MLRIIRTYGICVSGLLFWGIGCSAVLGIEELGPLPPNGSAGQNAGGSDNGGTGGKDASAAGGSSTGGRAMGTGGVPGGGGSATGGRSGGGAGGSIPDGSTPDGQSPDGSAGAGGTAGAGGAITGGAGGSGNGGAGGAGTGGRAAGGAGGQSTGGQGGAGGATGGSTVTGKVIDYWRNPMADVVVSIGGTNTSTAADGTFTVNNVAGTYDVSLVASWFYFDTVNVGWIYQGLTRRDPTLQIYQGVVNNSGEANATTTGTGVAFPLAADQKIQFAYGSPNGYLTDVIDESPENLYWFYWYGAATSTGTGHALRWRVDTSGFPATFLAHDAKPLTVNENTPAALAFLLSTATITTGNITGSVTGFGSSPENHVYERFTDGAAIEIVYDTAPAANFSYKVPSLPNGGVTMAAVNGTLGYAPIAIAYKDDLAPGQSASFNVPNPPAQLGPVNNSITVNANTDFTWNGTTGVSIFTIWVDSQNTGNEMHIVTTAKSVKLPSFPATSFSVPPGLENTWFIEQHGTYATVDAVAGPTGYLDTFAYHEPRGPRRMSNGLYLESTHRYFTKE